MKLFHILLMAYMVGVTIFAYPQLPESMPTHWNIRGEIDGWMPKPYAAWLMPGLVFIMWLSFYWLPKLDPKKEKYQHFSHEWGIIQTGIMTFFAYLHTVIMYVTLNPDVSLMPFMFVGLGSLFVLIGNYLSKVRQNYFIGIKVPWTLSSEENWNKTHRFASWWFVGVGIITIIEAFVLWYAPVIIFGGIMLVAIMPMLYSLLLYKQALHVMKYIYIGLGIIAAILIL